MFLLCTSGFNYIKRELKNLKGNYFEIGVLYGNSIRDLSIEYPDRRIIGVDPFIEDGWTMVFTNSDIGKHTPIQKQNTLTNIEGKTNITLYEMTSQEFYRQLTDELVTELDVCAILIDGSHWYNDVKIDIELALKLINGKPGVIIFDDLYINDVNKCYREFVETHGSIIKSSEFISNHNDVIAVNIN